MFVHTPSRWVQAVGNVGGMDQLKFTEPLLTAEQEVELALAIEAGLLARQMLDAGQHEFASASELAHLVEIGEAAHGRLARANMKLVASVVRSYRVEVEDHQELFQEGVLGLLEAIRRFDHMRGWRFATLALHWIRMRVGDAVATQCGRAGIPTGRAKLWRQAHGKFYELAIRIGRTPSIAEVADEWGYPLEWVAELLAWETPESLPAELAIEKLNPGNAAVDVSDVRGSLSSISATQRQIIVLRYGLDEGEVLSAKQVADRLGLSESTVRRRERDALHTLASVLEPLLLAA